MTDRLQVCKSGKSGGTHLRSIKRNCLKELNAIDWVKEHNMSERAVMIGIIRKGDRYVPSNEWIEFHSFRKYLSEPHTHIDENEWNYKEEEE